MVLKDCEEYQKTAMFLNFMEMYKVVRNRSQIHDPARTEEIYPGDIRLVSVEMEILLEPTSNKLMVVFYISMDPVKEILLKLNLPDHMVDPLIHGYLKMEVKRRSIKVKEEFQRSFRHSDTERLSQSDEVLKLKNFKKDATLKLFNVQSRKV
ncbi:hypothetical protein Tco_0530094 [Tanacetum coccineum]